MFLELEEKVALPELHPCVPLGGHPWPLKEPTKAMRCRNAAGLEAKRKQCYSSKITGCALPVSCSKTLPASINPKKDHHGSSRLEKVGMEHKKETGSHHLVSPTLSPALSPTDCQSNLQG